MAGAVLLAGGCSSHPPQDQRVTAICNQITAADDSNQVFNQVRLGSETPAAGGAELVTAAGVVGAAATQAQNDGFPDVAQAAFEISGLMGNLASAVQTQNPGIESDDLTKIAVGRQTLTSACNTDARKY